jgi:hypothetical protein
MFRADESMPNLISDEMNMRECHSLSKYGQALIDI